MNRPIIETELKKAHVSLKGWVALECDDCKDVWQPFNEAIGAKRTNSKTRLLALPQQLQPRNPGEPRITDCNSEIHNDPGYPGNDFWR